MASVAPLLVCPNSLSSCVSPKEEIIYLSLSILREYLAKNKLYKTLDTLYEEIGKKPESTTTSAVAKSLGLKEMVDENKKSESPLNTLLEMMAKYYYEKEKTKGKLEGNHNNNKSNDTNQTKPQKVPSSSLSLSSSLSPSPFVVSPSTSLHSSPRVPPSVIDAFESSNQKSQLLLFEKEKEKFRLNEEDEEREKIQREENKQRMKEQIAKEDEIHRERIEKEKKRIRDLQKAQEEEQKEEEKRMKEIKEREREREMEREKEKEREGQKEKENQKNKSKSKDNAHHTDNDDENYEDDYVEEEEDIDVDIDDDGTNTNEDDLDFLLSGNTNVKSDSPSSYSLLNTKSQPQKTVSSASSSRRPLISSGISSKDDEDFPSQSKKSLPAASFPSASSASTSSSPLSLADKLRSPATSSSSSLLKSSFGTPQPLSSPFAPAPSASPSLNSFSSMLSSSRSHSSSSHNSTSSISPYPTFSSNHNQNNNSSMGRQHQPYSSPYDIAVTDVDEDFDVMDSSSSGSQLSSSITSHPSSSSSSFSIPTHLSSLSFPSPTPISLTSASLLRRLIFGSNHLTGQFSPSWTQQGFYFREEREGREKGLSYGLVQKQGGPCGVLAVVQGMLLMELLYTGKHIDQSKITGDNNSVYEYRRSLLLSDSSTRLHCLISALSTILINASNNFTRNVQMAVIGNNNGNNSFHGRKVTYTVDGKEMITETYKNDGLTENLSFISLQNKNLLLAFLYKNITLFTSPDGKGVLLLLYSVIMTYTLDNIISDKDVLQVSTATLIGQHSYCTQEMVNLMLVGTSVSNVFNGNKLIGEGEGKDDKIELKGILSRGQIGFLSLFEHHEYIEVGTFYKNPLYPIWVVCSESHYTVMFSLDFPSYEKSNGISFGPKEIFDLFYYDELAKQKEEIRLTINCEIKSNAVRDKQLEPPINDVIRTKWGKNAKVNWNETEEIL